MVIFKVGDKVRVRASRFHGLEDGSICVVTGYDSDSKNIKCTDRCGFSQWVNPEDVTKILSDSDIELAHEMNKTYDLWERNSNLLDEMVDMVEQLGLLKGDVIDDRLVTNFADRYLGGF